MKVSSSFYCVLENQQGALPISCPLPWQQIKWRLPYSNSWPFAQKLLCLYSSIFSITRFQTHLHLACAHLPCSCPLQVVQVLIRQSGCGEAFHSVSCADVPAEVHACFQVRSTGPVNPVTRQPIKGRKFGGGIRFGEMERDALLAHGAAYLLHDRLHTCSDYTVMEVCSACGSLLSPNQFIPAASAADLPRSGGKRNCM